MSKFLKNLSSSGIKVHSRYSGRGRQGFTGPSTSIDLNINFPLQSFIDRVAKKQRNVLYYSGRYAMRTFRSQLRRKPPAKRTKTGRIRQRYREEMIDKKVRPPYFRTGILYRSVDFIVNEQLGRFDAGPPKITGIQKFTKSRQAVPGLLDQGGPAVVRVGRRSRRKKGNRLWSPEPMKWEPRQYRAFPYQQKVFTKTVPFFKKKLETISL